MALAISSANSYVSRELVEAARVNKWLITAWCLGMLVLSLLAATVISPKYETSAILVIPSGPEYAIRPTLGEAPPPSSTIDPDRMTGTEVALLQSDDLHRKVIETVGLERLYPEYVNPGPLGQAMKQFTGWFGDRVDAARALFGLGPDVRNNVPPIELALVDFDRTFSAEDEKLSNAITVKYRHLDPDLSYEVMKTLERLYIEQRRDIYLDPQATLATNEVEGMRKQFEDADHALEAYKKTHDIQNYTTRLDILMHQQGDLEKDAQDARASEQEAMARIASLQEQLKNAPGYIRPPEQQANGNGSTRSNGQLPTRTLYGLQNPVYQGVQTDLLKAQSDLVAARAQREHDAGQIAAVTKQSQELSGANHELEVLQEQRDSRQESYRDLLKMRNERQMSDIVNDKKVPTVRFIQDAAHATHPRMTRLLIIALGIFAALFGATAIVAIAHYRRKSYLFAEIVEQDTGITVLAIIPHIRQAALPAPVARLS